MSERREIILVVLCVVLGAGSPVRAQSPRLVNSRSLEKVISVIRPHEVTRPSRRVVVDDDRVEAAYDDFERTGQARALTPRYEGGHVALPFGHTRPVVHCPRLNACVISLEPGETLADQPLSGDTERWIIDTSVMGGDAPTPLVVVKPQDCDISTNLLIPTDRRVYELALVSDACESPGSTETFTRQVRFWYPDKMLAVRAAGSKHDADMSAETSEAVAQEAATAPEVELNRDYDIDRGWFLNRKRYPWIPVDVFDDGVRTYIVLPKRARTLELPILYLLEGDERHVLNYALQGDTIIADRVLRKAVLVVNTGGGEQNVEIENRAPLTSEERQP